MNSPKSEKNFSLKNFQDSLEELFKKQNKKVNKKALIEILTEMTKSKKDLHNLPFKDIPKEAKKLFENASQSYRSMIEIQKILEKAFKKIVDKSTVTSINK